VVASRDIANASLANNTVATFGVPTLWASGALHFHLYSTVADGTVMTGTLHDLETCSYIQYYAKPTENATIICNGEKISLSTNEDGLLSGAIIDLDKGKYLWTCGSTLDVAKISDIYSSSSGGLSALVFIGVNGIQWSIGNGFLEFTCANDGTSRNVVYKVNTLVPVKHLKIKSRIYSTEAVDKVVQVSADGTNWTTITTVNNATDALYINEDETDLMNGLSTFYVRMYKAAVGDYLDGNILSIKADLDIASVPSIILQPLAATVQYSDNITLPSNADRVYLQYSKYANDRGVVMPHLEFCATAVPIKAVPIKVDNSGETNPAIKIIAAESTTCTVGTGSDEGGNFILNDGEYVTITTPSTQIKATYQIGKGTTAFTNLTMNRFYLSSNGVANSAVKDPSRQFNFYLGMLKEGVQKVVEGVQRAVNDISMRFVDSLPWQNWPIVLTWLTAVPTGITTAARWTQIGRVVFIEVSILATDSKGTTGVSFTLPKQHANNGVYTMLQNLVNAGLVVPPSYGVFYFISPGAKATGSAIPATSVSGQIYNVHVTGHYESDE
jgi:hypothetical protein